MIALYTINAAYANHLERETGSIEVGKLADLIVLDRNLFDGPALEDPRGPRRADTVRGAHRIPTPGVMGV